MSNRHKILKMILNLFLFACMTVFCGSAFGHFQSDGFAPKNDWWKFDDINSKNANVTREQFNEVIDKVIAEYEDAVSSHGASIVVERNWTDSTVNAYASQSGNTWTVSMFGGLARREEITPDGFAIVVCHELGHHLAGFPFYGPADWAASEGQADYFATEVCARRVWANDKETNATFREVVSPFVMEQCDKVWADKDDQNLCYRIVTAGHSCASLLAALGSQPPVKFDQPDPAVVTATTLSHPAGQCRLDTYFQGSLCAKRFDHKIIPGRYYEGGQDTLGAEMESAKYACTLASEDMIGTRPYCWYAPQLKLQISLENRTMAEVRGNGNDIWEPGETYGVRFPLTNYLLKEIDGASLTLSSSDSRILVGSKVQYPPIGVGDTVTPVKGVEVTAAKEFNCGESFPLDVTVGWGNGLINEKNTAMVGEYKTLAEGQRTPAVKIPDNAPKGISDAITVNERGKAAKLSVTLNIDHSWPGDLYVSLISPSEKEYVVYDRIYNGDLKTTYHFEGVDENIEGDWALKVIDEAAFDVGTLNSWSIDFQSIYCENAKLSISKYKKSK